MKKITLLLLLLVGSFVFVQAQDDDVYTQFARTSYLDKNTVLPNSPEASSLGRYGEFATTPYTGAAGVGVSLHQLQGKTFSIPIQLSYDGMSPKVEQKETWVGLSWNLSVNYVVTRSVAGNPDLNFNYFDQVDEITAQTETDLYDENDFHRTVLSGAVETQSDQYYLTYPGGSAKFYITPTKKIIQKEFQGLSIEPTYTPQGDISNFTIRDSKGRQYEYGIFETTDLYLDDQFAGEGTTHPVRQSYDYNSAWYLTSIKGVNGIERATFNYDSEATLVYQPPLNPASYASKTYNPPSTSSPNCCGSGLRGASGGSTNTVSIHDRKTLRSIVYSLDNKILETIEFTPSKNDGPYADDTDKKLDKIRILRGEDGSTPILDFDFQYNYSADRLMLQSVQEKPITGTLEKPPYIFNYYSGTLPDFISNAQDHFGFYNGQTSNTSLLPKITLQGTTSQLNPLDANRKPSTTHAKIGMLEQVTYPTGGYTKYNWEAHIVAGLGAGVYCEYDPSKIGAHDRLAGGLRIANISHFDSDNSLLSKRSYHYEKENTVANIASSGLLLNRLDYTRQEQFTTYHINVIGSSDPCNVDNVVCNRTTISAISRSGLGTIKGSHVGYTRIEEVIESTEFQGNTAGKSVYHYKNQILSPLGENDNVENGLLIKKEVFDSDERLLQKMNYLYSLDQAEDRNRVFFDGFRIEVKIEQDNKEYLCQSATDHYSWVVDNNDENCVISKRYPVRYERKYIKYVQQWVYLSREINTQYFYDIVGTGLEPVVSTTHYTYGDTTINQATASEFINSDGYVYSNTTQFVNSISDTENYPVSDNLGMILRNMQVNHMNAYPLIQSQFINGQLVYKTKLEYNLFAGLRLPYRLYESFPGENDILSEEMTFYDNAGNLQQAHKHYRGTNGDEPSITLLWSHQKQKLAAQVQNAELGETAYTSFETTQTVQGNWSVPNPTANIFFDETMAYTGKGFFKPPSTATISKLLRPGKYILAFYTSSPDDISISGLSELRKKTAEPDDRGLYYQEYLLETNSSSNIYIEVGANELLDELRLYPDDALMSTFSYDKDTRLLLSNADANGIAANFQYDELLRNTATLNFDRHYLQLRDYLYEENGNSHNQINNYQIMKEGLTTPTAITAINDYSHDVIKSYSFFDGLGRPDQSVNVRTSPTYKDVIQFTEYDEFGRVSKQYLPYTAGNNIGNYRTDAKVVQAIFIDSEYGNANKHLGFQEYILEDSPLNRVLEVKAPGDIFRVHPQTSFYQSNSVIDSVRDFRISDRYYQAGSLFKTIQLDENENSLTVYTDKLGRRIMQDQEGSQTYYIYDTKGLLIQVIPPLSAELGLSNTALTYSSVTVAAGSYHYTYDKEYRLKTKIVPGCQAYTYYYDDLDQLVLTIDGNGFKTFTKYDRLGRPIMTGRYTGTSLPNPTMDKVFEIPSTTGPHYYTTDQSFPDDGSIDIYTVQYYDDYDIDHTTEEELEYQANSTIYFDELDYNFVRGKPTVNKVAILKSDGTSPEDYLQHITFYDKFSRVLQTKNENHLAGEDITWFKYYFTGWLERSQRLHSTLINGTNETKTINEQWTYDKLGRGKVYNHGVNNGSLKTIHRQNYNERGELSKNEIGHLSQGGASATFLQTVDYDYNIRGWLKNINDPSSMSDDVFAMNINYGSQYNGNIQGLTWKHKDSSNEQLYNFTYDGLNRLEDAFYYENGSGGITNIDKFSGHYEYDKNGNIKNLQRYGIQTGGTIGLIDILDYDYNEDGSLDHLTETRDKTVGFKSQSSTPRAYYQYDNNGNVVVDDHKGITVTYNFLNLPTKVTRGTESIEWMYDATGKKLSKTVRKNGSTPVQRQIHGNPILSQEYEATESILSQGKVVNGGDVTFSAGEYISLQPGFEASTNSDFLARITPITNAGEMTTTRDYCMGLEYNDGVLEANYFTGGRVVFDAAGNQEYQYAITDYQGNTRSLFKDNGSGVAEEVEHYDYYPFGALHSQETNLASKYTFGGKELQTELDLEWSDFGTRCFDAWSAKWQGVDILAEAKPFMSPYSYGLGNPIRFSDPSGMIEEDQDGLMSVSTDLWGGGRNQSFMDQSANVDGFVNVQNEYEGDPPNEYEVKLNEDGSTTTTYIGSGGGDETDYITYVDSEGNEIDSEELDVKVEYTSGPGSNPVKNPTLGSRLYHGKEPTIIGALATLFSGGSSNISSNLGFAKEIPKPTMSQIKKALKKVYKKLGIDGPLPKMKKGTGPKSTPRAGTEKLGYRLDPPHKDHKKFWHIDYWWGKRKAGKHDYEKIE